MKRNFTLLAIVFLVFTGAAVAQTVEFTDDFEAGTDKWTLTGSWGTTTEQANGGANSLADSPGGNYAANLDITATTADPMDLSAALDATLKFDAIFDIEGGNFDYCFVEASADGGTSWFEIARFLGEDNLSPWVAYEYSLGGLAGSNAAHVRFRLFSDGGYEVDGIYIDNVEVTSSDQDNSAPLVIHTPPAYYEGEAGDVTMQADLVDISGIGSATLNYTVDGGASQAVTGTSAGGDSWEFVIPTQEAGAQVDYSVTAVDASSNSNSITSATFSYIAGQHEFVDNGVVNFVQSFGPSAQSMLSGSAVRYTLDDRRIAFALIRNYTDQNRPNDDMEVHVWGVDSTGMFPGEDLIPPLTFTPEANLDENSIMTRVDLRAFEQLWNITGDVFIGFTVASGQTWIVQTTPAIGGATYVLGAAGWAANTGDDYHYRIVTADPMMTNVEELIFDQSIELFPNPTSGNAQLQLDLERTSDLTIQITNQLGQVVDFLEEKRVGFGNIELNTAALTPGIYYITISNGEVVSTKKLLKQ